MNTIGTQVSTKLQLCFPQIFALVGHQQASSCTKIFQEILDYFRLPQSHDFLLILGKDQKEIRLKLLKKGQVQIIFKPNYGCAVVLRKKQEFTPIEVYLVFPKEWDFQKISEQTKTIHIPCLPNSSAYIQIGVYKSYSLSLSEEKQNFTAQLNRILASQQAMRPKIPGQTDRKNHHTPSWMLQIAKLALAKANQRVWRVRHLFQLEQCKQQKKKQQQPVSSKGGSLDVGIHTGISMPNTTLQVVKSCFWLILQEDQLVELLLLEYRVSTLLAQAKNTKCHKTNLKLYFQVLSQVVFKLKSFTNKQIEFKDDVLTNNLFNLSIDLRNKAAPKEKPSTINNKKLLQGSQFKIQSKKFQFYSLLDYERRIKNNVPLKGNLGFSQPLDKIESFTGLLYNNYQNGLWVLLAEKFFFKIASTQLTQQIDQLQISINMNQIKCDQKDFSIMHKVINRYESLMRSDQSNLGMKLANQAESHIYLIKYIGAAIAFEVLKKERRDTATNLEDYRIRLPIDQLYRKFYSLNYRARAALSAMVIYARIRQEKQEIFVLDGSKNSFYSYALKVSEQSPIIQHWIKNQLTIQQNKVANLKSKFINYEIRLKHIRARYQSCLGQVCKCYQKQEYYGWNNQYKRQVRVECIRCKRLPQLRSQKNAIQHQKEYYIICNYARDQTEYYFFLHNIPNDILGFMKVVYESQVNINNSSNYSPQNFFTHSFSPLQPFVNFISQTTFSLLLYYKSQPSNLVIYPSAKAIFLYRKRNCQTPLHIQVLIPQTIAKFQPNYQYMIDSPQIGQLSREHQTYSKLSLKMKNEDFNEYISYGNVRVSQVLQLSYLLQKLNSREIVFKTLIDNSDPSSISYNSKKAKMLILLNTVAHINAYVFLNKDHHFQEFQIVHESIEHFLSEFIRKWRFQDMYSLHIIGIIFSLFSTLRKKEQKAVQLVALILAQYEKFSRENDSANIQMKSQFAYFLHGAMAFFCQNITKGLDKQSIHIWTKLQLYFRVNKVFSDQNVKNYKYRDTILFYQQFRTKGILENIDYVKKYFSQEPNQLTQIVKQIDADISANTQWKSDSEKGYYVFSGMSGQNIYEVNLFSGILLKNGVEIQGLPEIIKKDPSYITIFGENRDLQVYTSPNGCMRTRSDFSYLFPNQTEKIIMFQFLILAEKQVQIRHIMKSKVYDEKQLKFTLVPKEILLKSNFLIPDIYIEQYFTWFCSQQQIVVFRGKQLTKMRQLTLIYLTSQSSINNNTINVNEGRIIQKKHLKNQLAYLKSKKKKRSKEFDLLNIFHFENSSLTGKANQNYIFNEGFKVLSAIQDPQYIIQIYSHVHQHQSEKVISKYWLHRFKLKFTVIEQGLLSDNFQGYLVRRNYNNHQLLPWLGWNKVNCLVLQKKEDELKFSKQNQHLVLIPYTAVKVQQQHEVNPIPVGQTKQMQVFSYQIHDHFKDLRAKTKVAQLYLANIVAACYNPFFQELMMDNQEYAISLLRSCLIPSPLNAQQTEILEQIFLRSIKLNQVTLTLLCQVLYKLSKINNCLTFPHRQQKQNEQKSSCFVLFQDQIQNRKYTYRRLHSGQQISKRKQLKEQQINMLGLDKSPGIDPSFSKKNKSKWQIKNGLKIQISPQSKSCLEDSIKWLQDFNNDKNSLLPTETELQTANQAPSDIINLTAECVMSKQQKTQIENSIKSYIRSKGKQNNMQLEKDETKSIVNLLQKRQEEGLQLKKSISNAIKISQVQNYKSCDNLISKYRVIKQRDITAVLCEPNGIKAFYPGITAEKELQFKQFLVTWLKLVVATDSLHRIILILKNEEYIDKVGLLKQIESPRKQIEENYPWLCFEVELKSQIWLSQFETFKLLRENKSGSLTQLNMGQGKTQVIIPMIVLDEIYTKKQKIPRVNILSPLFQQAQNNYFKFLSVTGFKITLIPIYFNRTVLMTGETLSSLQYSVNSFRKKCLILIDRDSSLSLILKTRQQQVFKNNKIVTKTLQKLENENFNYKDLCIFRNLNILDIFDEVDALMTCVKSFVYAVGNSRVLPDAKIRYDYSMLFLEIVMKQMLQYLLQNGFVVIEQSLSQALAGVKEGKPVKGLRFMKNLGQNKLLEFRKKLIDFFFNEKNLQPEFQFYKYLSEEQISYVKQYMINSEKDETLISKSKNIPESVYNQIYIVRGILAFGVLQHCLSLRNGVQFGVPGKQNLKRVAVPYEAADVPSKRSEYSHPQVATLLSYIAYYNKGLNMQQFESALMHLLSSSRSAQNKSYQMWMKCIQKNQMRHSYVKQSNQINMESETQKKELYQVFRNCRATIAYWLIHCIFVTDLNQYPFSMTASSWDLADSKHSLGFSGTKDTHFLLPTYLTLVQSPNDEINGTDGKMISLIIQNTLSVSKIKESEEQLWKRFCQTALELNSTCIIDAGAILAGKSLQNEIIPWLSHHELFKKTKKLGISYCNQNGHWKVLDAATQTTIDRDTSIPEEETFVVFDEARTRGADMKLKVDAIASLSLGPNMTKDKMMQAVGRLRKFGRNQKIIILSTEQNLNKISELSHLQEKQKEMSARKIIEWTCRNAINQNKKWLYHNTKLAWTHFGSKQRNKKSLIHQFKPQLEQMYKSAIKFETVAILNEESSKNEKVKGSLIVNIFCQKINKYGSQYKVRCQNLDNVCERQVQIVKQVQNERQIEFQVVEAIPQNDHIQQHQKQISSLEFQFSDKLQFTKNFINCTKISYNRFFRSSGNSNQLCQINFLYIKGQKMTVVTQREATLKLLQRARSIGPLKIQGEIEEQDFIVRFCDLSINTPFIRERGLESALTDAQFFNGNENFLDKSLLLKTIQKNIKLVKKKDLQKLVCHFLLRRRTLQEKYQSSHIEDVYKQLINSKND